MSSLYKVCSSSRQWRSDYFLFRTLAKYDFNVSTWEYVFLPPDKCWEVGLCIVWVYLTPIWIYKWLYCFTLCSVPKQTPVLFMFGYRNMEVNASQISWPAVAWSFISVALFYIPKHFMLVKFNVHCSPLLWVHFWLLTKATVVSNYINSRIMRALVCKSKQSVCSLYTVWNNHQMSILPTEMFSSFNNVS